MIPMLKNVKSKNRIQKLYFVGINKNDMVTDNEIVDGYNLDTNNLPAMSPRKPKEVLIGTIITPNGFTLYKDKVAYQDGALLMYDGSSLGAIADSFKSFETFNKELIIMPDKKYFDGTTLDSLQGTIYIERGDLDEDGIVILDENKVRTRGHIMVVGGETLTFSNTESYDHDVYEFDKDFEFIKVTTGLVGSKTVQSDTEYVKMVLVGSDVNVSLTVNTTKGYPSEGELPNVISVVEHYNRLFGIKENSIYASAWSDKDNWAYFQGLDNDSWAIDTRSAGDFLAITNYQNHVVFFKENEMMELYGYNPSDFQLQKISEVGAINQQSVCEYNSVLYFISKDDIYAYSGGIPRSISEKLNIDTIEDGAITASKDKVYVSFTQNGTDYTNYVYDIKNGAWLPLDTKQILQFKKYKGEIYALTVDGNIEKYDSGVESILWGFTTKKYNDGSYNNKVTTKMRFRMKMEYNSLIKIFIKYDQGEWELKESITNFDDKEDQKLLQIVLAPQRHQIFQIKLECHGKSIIWGEREVYEVGDRNVKT